MCGLLLVLQLVAGEKGTCDLLTKHHRCNESFDFTAICKQIKKKIDTIDLAFDAIEEEVKRRSGARVEQLLKKVFFNLLQKAREVAKKQSTKKEINEIEF